MILMNGDAVGDASAKMGEDEKSTALPFLAAVEKPDVDVYLPGYAARHTHCALIYPALRVPQHPTTICCLLFPFFPL